ncbi:hypothetical protein H0H93_007891 [Arthromyces matolae]|nr:hypothetical protein H0H93_007891 [Arthromyces matolae]
MSATSTPIKLGHALDTLGMDVASPTQNIVKRGVLLRRMENQPLQPAQRSPYDEEVLELAHLAAKSFPGNIDPRNMELFFVQLTDLSRHLQSKQGDDQLSESVAISLRTSLDSWKTGVHNDLKHAADYKLKRILAQIATCRNIVEETIAPSESHFPDEINVVLGTIEDTLPGMQRTTRRDRGVKALEQLQQYLLIKNISDIGARHMNAKLLTYGEWVEGWFVASKQKVAALEKVEACKEIMRGKALAALSQVAPA